MLKRLPLPALLALALGPWSSPADALGFGRAQTAAVLGTPLDFRIGLRLEANETLEPACVSSNVLVGESLVPQSAISIVLEGEGQNAALRVRTSVPMTEPLVVVSVTAGCTVKVTRRFTLFADPPGHRVLPPAPPAAVAAAPAAAPGTSAPVVGFVMPSAPPAPPAVLPLAPAASEPPPAAQPAPTQGAVAPPPPPATAAPAAAPAPASAPVPAPAPVAPARPPAPATKAVPEAAKKGSTLPTRKAEQKAATSPDQKEKAAAAKPAAPVPAPALAGKDAPAEPAKAAAAGTPRLKLESPKITSRVLDAAAAAERDAVLRNAEDAAISAKAAAEAAEARAAQLERSVTLLQQESKANREALARLTQALEDSRGGGDFAQWLIAAVAGLLGLSGFLALRLRRLQSQARKDWTRLAPQDDALAPLSSERPSDPSDAGHGADLGPAALNTLATPPAQEESFDAARGAGASVEVSRPLPSLSLDGLAGPDAGSAVGEEFAGDRTQLLPPSGPSVSAPIRPVSIEELLDLEQQLEFFEVLGQDDAALALLVEHLRHTGGTYPLPYLKLMELYRRKGDAEAYERTRDRFNQRFNAVAPAWGAASMPQRSLEDYPETLRQIQQIWARPVDATALLENMLFRTEGGELFDLNALAEVLFLFTLARDLLDHQGGEASTVDVLLPLGDGGNSESILGALDDRVSRPPEAPPISAPSPQSRSGQGLAVAAVGAAGATAAALGAAAEVAQVRSLSLSDADSKAGDDIDIPLGEPMLEPLFLTEERASAEPVAAPEAIPSIDLPLPGDSRSAELVGAGDRAALDLDFGLESVDTSQPQAAAEDRPVDFDLSDFDLPVASVTTAPSSGGTSKDKTGSESATDAPPSLDFNIDGLSLDPPPANGRGGDRNA